MLMNGDIFITNDCDLANRLSIDPKFKIMSLTEKPDALLLPQIQQNCLGFLLPTYAALDAQDIGNMNEFYRLYYIHLSSPEATSYILLLIMGIYKGYTMILYVPREDCEMEWVTTLLNFINQQYGLYIGNMQNTRTMFNQNFTNRILFAEFQNGYMHPSELLKEWIGDIDDITLAAELCNRLNMSIENNDPMGTINNYKNADKNKKGNSKPIVPLPFTVTL